jgi:enoyl-CoA hydratase/carnithine racemase
VLRLAKPRGNAIDDALAEALVGAAVELQADDSVAGVLLASAHPRLFCPGLDLVALAGHDRPAMRRFLQTFVKAVAALYALGKPVVAAVGGTAVAGGCILALASDHRILRRGAAIGLNEVKLGVPLPWPVTVLLRARVAAPALGRIALLGRNFTDDEAVAVGLADELGESDGFDERCLARLAEFVEKDGPAFAATKAWLRGPSLREMRADEADHLEPFLDAWFSPATRERMLAVVASLGRKG